MGSNSRHGGNRNPEQAPLVQEIKVDNIKLDSLPQPQKLPPVEEKKTGVIVYVPLWLIHLVQAPPTTVYAKARHKQRHSAEDPNPFDFS